MGYVAKFYAPVSANNAFDFGAMKRKKSDVKINSSDAYYGGCTAKRIGMQMFCADIPVSENLWAEHHIAWIVQNPTYKDDPLDFWWDTLSATEAEAVAWLGDTPSRKARSEAIGLKVVSVVFEVIH